MRTPDPHETKHKHNHLLLPVVLVSAAAVQAHLSARRPVGVEAGVMLARRRRSRTTRTQMAGGETGMGMEAL